MTNTTLDLITDADEAIFAMQGEQISLLDGGDAPDYQKVVTTISPDLWDDEEFVQKLLHVMRFEGGESFIRFASRRVRSDPEFLIRVMDQIYGRVEDQWFYSDKPSMACNFIASAMPDQHREALSIYGGLLAGLYAGDVHEFLESEFVEVADDKEDIAVQSLNIVVANALDDVAPLHKWFWAQYQAMIQS